LEALAGTEEILAMLADVVKETAIRPFHVNVPEAELTELSGRILATKWPDRETVADATQGVQLATMQALARYWATEYDRRKIETKLNALPQFITEIDGLDIHFIHLRSKLCFRRGSRGLHIAAVEFFTREEEMRHA
jgi:hypothetical protein